MTVSVFLRPLSLVFAIVALIVSLIWAILSFLAILCYNDVLFGKDSDHFNFGLKNFTDNLYELYLSGTNFSYDRAVIPSTFNVLMWIYFLLTVFLLFSSGVQIVVLTKRTKPRKLNFSTIVWLFLNYTVCIFDFITCILFGVDYYYIRQKYSDDSPLTELKLAVPITLIILSAKGFVLWIVNVTFTIIITVLFSRKAINEPILKHDPEAYAKNNAAYDVYGDPVQEDNRKRSTGTDSQYTEKSDSSDNSVHESENSFYNANTDGILTTTSTWSRAPRVHTDSYVRPRSLVASLNPSPVPPPTLEEPARQHEQISIYNSYRSINDYDYIDPEVEVAEMSDPSYLKSAFPKARRFTIEEPAPDYNIIPKRFTMDEPEPDYYTRPKKFTMGEPEPDYY